MSGKAEARGSFLAPLRLTLLLATVVPLGLFWIDVLARDTALVAYLALVAAATIVEWRAAAPLAQIGLSLATSVAVALLVFDVLPFLPGLVLVVAAFTAEFSYGRRTDEAAASLRRGG